MKLIKLKFSFIHTRSLYVSKLRIHEIFEKMFYHIITKLQRDNDEKEQHFQKIQNQQKRKN